MEVCTVCGALLVVGDVQQRIDEHLMGKQHAGYARIRSYVEEWKKVCNIGIISVKSIKTDFTKNNILIGIMSSWIFLCQ